MNKVFDDETPTVWTIGHSTRLIQDFLALLFSHSVKSLVDVRSYPGSRRYPQFNRATLGATLAAEGIDYHHVAGLGGRRRPTPQSKNTAWQNPSFRAYADHMESEDFEQGIGELLRLALEHQTAIMCAEAVWWRCHRGLIADYLKASGVRVLHIIDVAHVEEHPYTTAARIIDGKLSYVGLLPADPPDGEESADLRTNLEGEH
jgi:uncharacterized protein (DUF488 family)